MSKTMTTMQRPGSIEAPAPIIVSEMMYSEDVLSFEELFAQMESEEEGVLEYAEEIIKRIQESFEVDGAEAREWFRAIFQYGRSLDWEAIDRAVERVDFAQLYEILASELEKGECPLESLQAVVDILAEAFCVGHKIKLVIYQSDDVLEKNDYGRYLNFEWEPLEKTFKCLEIRASKSELEKNLSSISEQGIEKCLSILVENLAHEVWHAYQTAESFKLREELSEDNSKILPASCSQAALYWLNLSVYVNGADNKFYYRHQLIEREAKRVQQKISHCMFRFFSTEMAER